MDFVLVSAGCVIGIGRGVDTVLWQRDSEYGAARRIVGDGDRTAVELYVFFHDMQSDAASCAMALVVSLIEALEDTFLVFKKIEVICFVFCGRSNSFKTRF